MIMRIRLLTRDILMGLACNLLGLYTILVDRPLHEGALYIHIIFFFFLKKKELHRLVENGRGVGDRERSD